MATPTPIHEMQVEMRALRIEMEAFRRSADKLLNEHDLTLHGDGNGNPGLRMRMDRLEQKSVWHSKLMWSVWGALMALATGVAANWIKP